jgi:type IV secretion system protein VirB9
MSGCATQRPAPNLSPPKIVSEAPAKPQPSSPVPTGKQLLEQQSADVQQAVRAHQDGSSWPVYKSAERALYPYGRAPQPIVDCAPLRTTDVQLQPGETITDVAMGDTERWMATPASSGDPRNPVPHLAVKPQSPGLETNLTIYTTRHIYHLILRSRGRALQEVEFYYPDELVIAMKDADLAASKANQTAADPSADSIDAIKFAVDPSQLNFDYTVSGANVAWKPTRAFDDGSRLYVEMPDGMKSSEAPALLIDAGGGTQMVNYRVDGNYYVVDRLVNEAILVSGVGRNHDQVTISYMGAPR